VSLDERVVGMQGRLDDLTGELSTAQREATRLAESLANAERTGGESKAETARLTELLAVQDATIKNLENELHTAQSIKYTQGEPNEAPALRTQPGAWPEPE